ncbi:hypothetical protein BKA64DRAFT_681664 [Cadophora sp. MPI-SDFR-AT-0126]|nr:hypothetical protein BKA64DRAFT_681664 [Leotiomycetes sp. MPI-SDFR-AT-0126]
MDLDDPDNVGGDLFSEESSGSAYEISDDEQSHDEDAEVLPTSRAGSERGRSRSVTSRHGKKGEKDTSNRGIEDATEWASSFQAPKVEDIKTPRRLSRGGKKRKAPKPAAETRVKRLKSFYSNDYRELLNCEIQDAASRVADGGRLKASQIGSSIWTATEKGILFAALERLGRDDVRAIAERIGSKSQYQVQEYANLLREESMRRKENYSQLLAPTDFPVAVEISDECCDILERAGDALAAHQELAEEKVETAKWGDTWLINEDVALQIEKKRRQESGEEEMEEVLPAANLLDLSKWIELSDRIFMNSGTPRGEDNWQSIAEEGEAPAVRATAFEDFHSLAYNITKRLVSTALFCSMSRQRARGFNKVKHAEVNTDDVAAAVTILGLKADSHDFWTGVAKRCSLQVIDDGLDEPVEMTNKEVEKALRERDPKTRSRSLSRARSMSRARSQVRSDGPNRLTTNPEHSQNTDSEAEAHTDSHSESEYLSLPNSDEEFMSSPPPESSTSDSEPTSNPFTHPHPHSRHQHLTPTLQQDAEISQDADTEAHDMYTSQTEEIRLWNLLKQIPPFEFTLSPVEGKVPKPVRDELVERENWRDYVGYVGEWEGMDSPVLREEFERNERRMERSVKRRARMVEEDGKDDIDVDEEEGGDGSEGNQVEDEDKDEDGQQDDGSHKVEQEAEDEILQVESPRHHSPDYQSPDREPDFNYGEGSLLSEDEDKDEEGKRVRIKPE